MTIARNLSFLAEGVSSTGVLGATYGGTGQSSITTGDLLYGSASNTISKLAIGSTGTILRVVAGVPAWGTDYTGTVTSVAATVPSFLSISGSPITTSGTLAITYSGTALPVANGGTGLTSLTAGQVLYGSFSQNSNFSYSTTNGLTANSYNIGYNTNLYNVDSALSSYASNNSVYLNGNAAGALQLRGDGTGAQQIIIKGGSSSYVSINTASAEAARIFASGGVSIGNTTDPGAGILYVSSGVRFPATQVASSDVNTLDDYEEGTFTPTISSGITSPTYTEQLGRYTKIGNLVYAQIRFLFSGGTGSGAQIIASGLPFASNANTPNGAGCNGYCDATTTNINWYVPQSSSTNVFGYLSGGTNAILAGAMSGKYIVFNVTYET